MIESFFTRGRWCEPRLRGRSGRFGARGKRLKADLGFDSEGENYEDLVKNLVNESTLIDLTACNQHQPLVQKHSSLIKCIYIFVFKVYS